jgi:hypothetical protein
MWLDADRTVGVHTYVETTTDGNGDPTKVYNPPANEDGTPQAVFGWGTPRAHGGGGEPREPDVAERVIVDVEVYVPPDFVVSARDLIDLPADTSAPAGQFEVIGYAADYNHGPFGWCPGHVVNLRKVEG